MRSSRCRRIFLRNTGHGILPFKVRYRTQLNPRGILRVSAAGYGFVQITKGEFFESASKLASRLAFKLASKLASKLVGVFESRKTR